MKELLKEINDHNILLEVINGELKVFAGGADINPSIISKIRERKTELVQFLLANEQSGFEASFKINIPVTPAATSYPLSSSQRRLWVLSQFEEGNLAYNMPGACIFEGQLDSVALEYCFNRLIARHEILRTVFREDGSGDIRQYVLPAEDMVFRIMYHDLRMEKEQDASLKKIVDGEVNMAFDLATGPLLRAGLYQVKDDKWLFTYTMHHIISDAWSMDILIKELLSLYNGEDQMLTPLRIQYKDYAAWQQEQLSGDALRDHKAYWLKQFEGELPVLQLPGDRSRPAVKTYAGGMVSKRINARLNNAIKTLGQEQGSTLYMCLLAAVNTLLYRYTSQEDIIIGTSIASREHADLEEQIGFYVNTLALRTPFNGDDSFNELLKRVKKVTLEGYEHQLYPFDELVNELQLQRDMSRSSLFDVMVVLQNTGNNSGSESQNFGGLTVSGYDAGEAVISKFDLTFFFGETGDALQVNIVYNSDIFKKETVLRLANHLEQLLEAIIASPTRSINRLDYLSREEKEQLSIQFAESRVAYPQDRSVVDLFEEQAALTPDSIALVFEGQSFTYRQVKEQSDKLAHYLRTSCHIQANDLTGIMLDRSANMIIALLGVLKSGGAYVAIEPDTPVARKEFIIKDTGIKALITQTEYVFDLGYYGGHVFAIDIQLDGLNIDTVLPALAVDPASLAYVIYTSGSTGQPKGVMVSHRALVDYVFGILDRTNIMDCKSFGLVSTIAADLGNTVLYPSLLTGGALHVFAERDVMDRDRLIAANLDCVKIVPSHWKALQDVNSIWVPDKCLIFGGEQLTEDVIALIGSHKAGCDVYNHYGPSETTIGKLINRIDVQQAAAKITLGKPFCNSRIYIVDGKYNLQPVGVVGEICIGGDGMSAGYLNKADLTAEKFVSNPFKKGERYYKTGDLGRWLSDGTVEFLGRKDDQVKIRGYRIELGEIENTLKKYPDIENAVVLAKVNSTGEKAIVAWLVTREPLSKTDLQNWLGRSLPSYMFPNHYVCIPELPLTPNGKIDRKKLPDPEGDGTQTGATYVAPRTAIEQKLVLIWQEVLGKERVGVKDNFFDLGGHSLKATRLASQIYRTFEVKVDFHELFTKIVLEEQAELISQAKKTSFIAIPAAVMQPDYPLSSSQRRLWILSQFKGGNIAYNVPGVFVFEGTLHMTALSNSFNTLIARHEILRTVFKEDGNGKIRQFIGKLEDTGFTIAYKDVRNEAQQEEKVKYLVQEAISETFDLSAGPLVSASLFQVADNRWVFAFNMHHIISDGWSKEVLVKELLLFYKAYSHGTSISLPPLRIQYKDYAVWQQEQLSGEASNIHKAYWLKQFEGELPVLELPADKMRPAVKTYNGDVVRKRINSKLSKGLYTLTQQQGSTLFMGLLATVNALLYRYTNQEDIIIGSQIAGREHADLEDQIGNYLNTLALRTRFKGDNSYRELLEIVRGVSLDAYAHQLYPFDELVEALPLRYDMSRNPLFDVSVVLQNAQMNNQPELPDLGDIKINAYGGVENTISKFDLAFDFMEVGEEIQISIVYNNDIYLQSTAERFIDHLNQLLEVIIACPDKPINELEFLNEKEKSLQLIEYNNAEVAYPHNKTIAALFSAQALKTPDHIAVVFEDRLLTYKDLDEQSNQLAAYLVSEHHVQADDLIGIMLNRSEKVIVAILGILKAGAAYVPVDPEYPEARLQFILSDIGAKVLITQTDYIFDLGWYQGTVFAIDVELDTIDASANYAGVNGNATDLAYVMYTSGSTGNPKGVMVENRSVVRLVKSANYVDFNEDNILLSTGALSFDATSFEYWGMLLNGGRLVMCRQDTLLDTQRLAAEISNRGVNIMWFTAGWLNQLVDSDIGVFKGLKTILAGGDRLSMQHINALLETYPGITIVNGYGPTENTTFSLTYRMSSPVQHIPVGKPINNSTVYIINDKGVLQPLGAVGEICVGGAGLARGYLNNDALTAAKFVENRYAAGERMYKTGDLGRWQADGNIAFIGRKDDQVKIRGYRIELGEIERALQSHQHIDSAVVVTSVNASGEKALVAYLVSETILQASDIRWYLSERLPAYMLPAQFVQLDSLPLTPNGKVDKGNLPEPEGIEISAGVEYVAPANETSAQMVLIWQDVLGRERIGIRDNFFDLGGDSIKILRMVSEVRKKLNFDIPIADIYKNNTIESIIANVLQDNSISAQNSQLKESEILVKRELEELKERILAAHPSKENIEDIYPMSDIEKGMVYESLISEGLGVYHDQLVSQRIIADFDIDRFRSAFELLVEKHAILRTGFNLGDYETEVQIVHKKIEVSIPCKDVAGLTPQEHEKAVLEFTQSDIQKPFEVSTAPLWRANIFKLSKDEIVFVFQFHHAILDGWSHASFITELNNLYLQLSEDPLYKPAKLKSSYKDFIIQHTIDIKENTPKLFWQNELAGYKRLDLFAEKKGFRNYIHTLDSNYLRKLKRVALELNTTVKVLSLSAYVCMLKVLSCDNEIVTGLVTNTRPSGYEDSDKILGCFLNTIPLRLIIDKSQTAQDLVSLVHNKLIGLKENERLSLLQIAKMHNEDSGNPFFDTFFDFVDFYAYKSITDEARQEVNEESASLVNNSSRTRTNMPLEVVINLTGDVYSARFRLSRELKSDHSPEDLANLYFSILNQIIGAPHQALKQLEYLRPEEKDKLLVAFNDTEIRHAAGKTVIDLFEEQVEKTPDNIALVFGETVLSYRELNNKCNQLANYLNTQYHVKAGDLVGVMLDRSENMLIAILGILKSGGAYVPIDPAYPATRKEYIIRDTGVKLLLTQTAYIFDLANYGGHLFAMDAQLGELETSIERPGVKAKPADVVYVIYTSGSTGQPKGCALTHGNLFNYIEWANNYYFSETTIASFGLFTSLSFDLTVTSIYCSLTQGGTLTIFDQDADISAILKDSFNGTGSINSIKLTPSHVNILQHLELTSTTMVCAILGGEEVTTEQVNILKQIHPSIKVYNEYGPTEATVGCVVKELEANKTIEIGKPIRGASIYILGADGDLCPIGVSGEMYIGGLGVAAGYLNRPELTAEKFVANPFRAGERMYRTGDLGRWLPDGNIKFLGRKDDQVKIRGYRVEPGEIENVLQGHPDVNAAAVLARQNQGGERELIAYIASDKSLTQTNIRSYLSGRIPAYMIPAHFIQLESLPLTPHGKVDKKSLPDPTGVGINTGVAYVAPRNEVEEKLVIIWQEILGKERIGIKDNFFDLGGHSLNAIRLVSQIHKEFEAKILLKELFTNAELEQQATLIQQAQKTSFIAISPVPVQSCYLLSSSQRRLWVLSQFEESNIAYNIPGVYVFEGTLNISALENCFKALLDRYEILRTVFKEDENGDVRQFIQSPEDTGFRIAYYDLRNEEGQKESLRSLIQEETLKPFDLGAGPLLRAGLYQITNNEWIFIYVMHHIISDGWSMGILIKELSLFYNACIRGEDHSLKPLRIQYKDYAAWQQEQLSGEALKTHREYWLKQFEGDLPVLALPADKIRPALKTYNGGVVIKNINHKLNKGLKTLAQKQEGTLFMALLATVNALLYRYSNQEDIVIGSPIAGREHIDLENQIGFYVNTLALRFRFQGDDSFQELLEKIKLVTLDAYEHQVYPIDELIDELDLQRDMSRSPLFDVMVVMQNAGNEKAADKLLGEIKVSEYPRTANAISKYDLTFSFSERGEELQASIEYNSDIYNKSTIECLGNHFEQLLTGIIEQPSIPIRQLDYLNNEEKEQLLVAFNDTAGGYEKEKTIMNLFEEQVEKSQNNIALRFKETNFTYKELNEKSNQLGDYLRKNYNIQANDLIGIKLERSEWMIITILAILKSGAAYVPIDPEYPQERIDYMIADSRCKVVINEEELERFKTEDKKYTKRNLTFINKSTDLAYLIYTSGSTGLPKGVMIEHKSLSNYIQWSNDYYFGGSGAGDFGLYTSLSFDLTVTSIFCSLTLGRGLFIYDQQEELSEILIHSFSAQSKINSIKLTPSHISILKSLNLSSSNIVCAIIGGEQVSMDQVHTLKRINPFIKIYNEYGPTEATVGCIVKELEENTSIVIGKPVSNTQIYILDNQLQLVSTGVIGEICIGGDGLARGYLNKPELTAEKFVASPFSNGRRIYKTGDLGRWLPDGNIEFLGRKDDQVKIRGYRIELGEIESAIQGHPDIDVAVVLARVKGADKELAGYIVSKEILNTSDLRSYLSKLLPGYMVPSYYVQLDKLPLTTNGKVDKKKLPDPEEMGMPTGIEYVAPRNATEEKLVLIWQEILGKDKIGVKDNFFDLGGHSLKATKLASQIHKEFEVRIELKYLFTRVVLEDQARLIKQTRKTTYIDIQPAVPLEYYPLSSAQKRLFYLHEFAPESTGYNMPIVQWLGKTVDKERIKTALSQVIARHENLRTSFEKIDGVAWQKIHGEVLFELNEYECLPKDFNAYLQSCIRPFHLNKAPLLRSALVKIKDVGYAWIVDIHHIISDGTSLQVLIDDFIRLYRGEVLPELPLQYKDFSEWQNKMIESGELDSQKEYWLSQFSEGIPRLNFPADRSRPPAFTFEGSNYKFRLNSQLTGQLKDLGKRYHGTLQMTLLSILNVLLYKYTGQDDIVIGCGIAGRRHPDVERIVGMFVNSLAIRSQPRGDKNFETFYKEVVSGCIAAYENQDVQFEDLLNILKVERMPSRNPIFDIALVVQNFDKSKVDPISLTADIGLEESPQEISQWKGTGTSKFDMTWFVFEADEEMIIDLEYYSAIYDQSGIERLVSHFINTLNIVVNNPDILLSEINILSREEEQGLLCNFACGEKRDYPLETPLHQLFEQQCLLTPDNISVRDGIGFLKYSQLDERSNRLAQFLYNETGLQKEDRVGILLSRSMELIVSVLGVLKAGGAYVPLDTEYPEERLLYMLEDAGVEVLLTEKNLIEFANRIQWRCKGIKHLVCVDSDDIYMERGLLRNELMRKDLWDHVGDTATDAIAVGGWKSSYTGEYLSELDMREYAQNAYLKLKDHLHPNMKVLEIGCSSGLTMFQIAPEVDQYYGTDLSSSILSYTSGLVKEKGYTNITLSCMPAHEIDQLDEGDFDLVIINSVIQSFDGHNYFRDVLIKAIGKMKQTGLLFLGDIMDEDSRQDLIKDLTAFKQAHQEKNYRTKTDWSAELFLSKDYLNDLILENIGIEEADYSSKIHSVSNELTRYRYDALLRINKRAESKMQGKKKYQHDRGRINEHCAASLNLAVKADDLAYVIYTSGSTGKPKGVMIEHRGVVNLIHWHNREYEVSEKSRATAMAGVAFDAFGWEVWPYLVAGATLYIINNELRMEPHNLLEFFSIHNITHSFVSTALVPDFVKASHHKKLALSYLLTGGDKLAYLNTKEVGYAVVNNYGPTEYSVVTTKYKLSERDGTRIPPIGSPIDNTTILLLDEDGRLVPVGVVGELCIGGAGLARGYLNQGALTEEKFRANPYNNGERIYKTGDLGRWLPDGNIEYVGRKDDQIKMRGHRIELGEIESALQSNQNIDAAVAMARLNKEGEKELVGYIVSNETLQAADLRSYLSTTLPVYMLPTHFVQLAALPLTPNGKVDRKRLPDPEDFEMGTGVEYVAPCSDKERNLVAVYEEVLKKQPIGIKEDFFVLGGDSIKSIQVVSRLKQRGYGLTIQDVMRYPVIEDLAERVQLITRSIDQGLVEGIIPLSPIQSYFLRSNISDKHHFNQSVMLYSREPLLAEALRASLHKLVLHHDALRMVYQETSEGWMQVNKGQEQGYGFEEIHNIDGLNFTAHCERIQASFNLAEGPLFKAGLFRGADGDRLLLVAHHLVIDGVSWRILFEDLSNVYQQYISGAPLQLPLKTDSFKYWQEKQLEYAKSETLQKEEAYWSAIESLSIAPLPLDHFEGSNLIKDISSESFLLDESATNHLLTKCYSAYRTDVNDILLGALSMALAEVLGLEKVLINLEGHGRENIGSEVDITRTAGWFTTMYPVVFDMSYRNDSIRQLIEVKETLHRVPNKGIGYGILRYLSHKDYKLNPEITFNYLGDFGSGVKAEQGEELFEFSGDDNGSPISQNGHRSAVLDVSGIVVGGKTRLSIRYSTKQYSKATIDRLVAGYQQQLEGLMEKLSVEEKGYLTPVDLTYKDLSVEQVEKLNADFMLEDIYPLSPLQEGLYYHWLSSPGSSAYFMQQSYQLKGDLKIAAFEESYQILILRHAILRTCFTLDLEERALQIVKKKVGSNFVYKDVSGDKDFSLQDFKASDRVKGFNLHTGSQMRLTVLGLGDNTYEFIWSHHHILMDGWCVGILIREFFQIYHSLVDARVPELNKVYAYSSYIDWLGKIDKEKSLRYWQDYLSGYDTIASIPALSVNNNHGYQARVASFRLGGSVRKSIRSLCADSGVTENTFFQAVWGILLSRYNNRNDVVFGSVVSGRPGEVKGIADMIGLFINTIPVRIHLNEEISILELLKEVHQRSIEGLDHHYIQLAEVQSASQLGRGLFNHILQFQNFPDQEAGENGSGKLSLLSSGFSGDNTYDFTCIISPGDSIDFKFHYNGNIYSEEQINRLQNHLRNVTEKVIEFPTISVNQLDYLNAEEKHQLLVSFNDTGSNYSSGRTVIDLFEEQVEKTPDAIALVFGETILSYKELNNKCNQLANYLSSNYHVKAGDIIGIMLDRSENMLIAILGILKSGGAYVPIDPAYPAARKEYIIQDTGIRLLLTQTEYIFDLGYYGGHVFAMDAQLDSLETSIELSPVKTSPRNVAYVIYTSGSTGLPKGCILTHSNLSNYIEWANNYYFSGSAASFGLYTSLSFDLTVTSIYCSLTQGGTLSIYDQNADISAILTDSFNGSGNINSIKLTPSHVNILQHLDISSTTMLYAIIGGEEVTTEQVNILKRINPAIKVFNEYGPTEATVGCVVKELEADKAIEIGKPISGASIYILGEGGGPCPIGVSGELYISGVGVAMGYLNRPELTAEKFIANPFKAGDRLYKTGDLGSWLADGNIKFLGRKDDQVKIRGYRIELGEIENVLQSHPKMDAAVVLIKQNKAGEKELVAYVVSRERLNTSEMRSYLSERLPSYMLPVHYVQLETMPITSNGKVDRKKLPAPEGLELLAGEAYVAPRNEVDEKLVIMWQEILGKERIGIKDNFFDLGGHSLNAIRLVSQIHKQFEATVVLKDIFANPTIETVSDIIRANEWIENSKRIKEENRDVIEL
jgi:tyrocidine synthetase III